MSKSGIKKVIVLGSGALKIGQAGEFDYSGSQALKALKEEGVEYIFGYPGACTIDISDELYKQDDITVILPRHEQALVHAADAYARTTGKVGVCLVTCLLYTSPSPRDRG